MKEAIDRIVNLKNWLDLRLPDKDWQDRLLYQHMIRRNLLSEWNQRSTQEPKMLNGETFIRLLLPFSNPKYQRSSAVVEHVSPNHVLAGQYIRRAAALKLEEAAEQADFLDNESSNDGLSAAQYSKIGPFKLYIAHEGKNRVSLYRRLERKIKARVNPTAYPSADSLLLRKIRPWSDLYALEYIGDDYQFKDVLSTAQLISSKQPTLAILPYYEAVELLTSFGVEEGAPIISLKAPVRVKVLRMLIGHSFYHS